MLQFMGSQRVRHGLAIEQQKQQSPTSKCLPLIISPKSSLLYMVTYSQVLNISAVCLLNHDDSLLPDVL